MKITIDSTTKVIELRIGAATVPARIWEGTTESGVPVHCFITRIAPTIPPDDLRQAEFQRELDEQRAPTPEIEAYPLRMIL
jgi:hypothetical protein